jgi:calcium-translocating P-type ATPase
MARSSAEVKRVVPEHEARATSYTWHAHDHREVLQMVQSSEAGLTQAEAHRRLAEAGHNEFTETPGPSLLWRLIEELRTPLALVLLVACGVTILLHEYIDAIVIAVALLIAVSVSLYQEGKASKAFAHLAASQVAKATVWRDGVRHLIEARELVVGDLVELQAGVQVPADLRLTKTKQLSINEAALTGEWLPVDKAILSVPTGAHVTERASMAYMGTFVGDGYGVGVVVAVGDATEVGAIAEGLQHIDDSETPLQLEMKKVSLTMMYIIGAFIVVLFALGLWVGQTVETMALMAIAIAVAAIPEGLPAAVTIILAVGMEALLKRGGLVRNLLAAETLGSTTYVLTDKTGTLTKAKMAVTGVITTEGTNADSEAWANTPKIVAVANNALCATDAFFDDTEAGRVARGEPVERAMLELADRLGVAENDQALREQRVDYLPFASENRFAAGAAPQPEGGYRLCVNGAPELLLEKATHSLLDGKVVALTNEMREQLLQAIDTETRAGKRLVATGFVQNYGDDIPEGATTSILKGLVFQGVLVFADPVRLGVRDAIAGVQAAGAKVLLITGDNPETALSIARKVGIAGEHESALIGSEVEELSDAELLLAISHTHVFARVLPRQKLRIAEVLQKAGEIVAMTGDGINDAPALQRANIGVATGSGTQVAQAASDLVLVNDSFATMYAAIEEGRRIVANLRKVIGYLLSTSFSEIILIMTALVVGSSVPITAVQILWANIIEEGLMSVAFAFEKGEKGAMQRRPQDIHEEGILSKAMLGFLGVVVVVLSSFTVALYLYLRSLDLSEELLRSAMFLSVAADSLFIAFAFRSLSVPIWRIPLASNRFFIGSFLISCVLLFGALSIPFMREVLSYTPLPANLVLLVFGLSAAGLATVELAKLAFFERRR